MDYITRAEAETLADAIAEKAADRAVEKLLLQLGVNPLVPEEVSQLRERLAFLSRMERGITGVATTFASALLKTCAVAAAGALLFILGTGFKAWIITKLGIVPPP